MSSYVTKKKTPSSKPGLETEIKLEEDSAMARVHHFFRLRFEDIKSQNPSVVIE